MNLIKVYITLLILVVATALFCSWFINTAFAYGDPIERYKYDIGVVDNN